MASIRVITDHWFNHRMKVEERALLMGLYYEMDRTNKVIIPGYSYLDDVAGITQSKKILKELENKKIIKVKIEKNFYMHIKIKKGEVKKVKEAIFLLPSKWTKTIILTLELMKGYKPYIWTDKGELSALFNCTPNTIYRQLKNIEEMGLIKRKRYLDKYKIELMV